MSSGQESGRSGRHGADPADGTGPGEDGDFIDTMFGRVRADTGDAGYRAPDNSIVAVPDEPRRSHRLRTALIVLTVLALIIGGAAAGIGLYVNNLTGKLDANIERIGDPFVAIPDAERPTVQPAAAKAVNILLVGSDSRISAGDPSQWVAGAQRTDAIMLMHLPADRSGAYVMSIPRDSWVDIPGYGKNKVNAAFSFGGPTLMIRTVEQLTGVRVDHFVVLDFEGFKDITDALGGVTITIPQATGWKGTEFQAGTQRMDGETALRYVRQRHDLPGGDFDRVKRQQNWIRAVARELLAKGTLTSPTRLTAALDAMTRAVATDDGFTIGEMRSLAIASRNVRSEDLTFLTVPVAGTGRSPDGKQSIVLLDEKADDALWQSVQKDQVGDWVTRFGDTTLDEVVR